MSKNLVALVGMKHRGSEAFVASLPQGEPLTLVRGPTNQYDPNAVMVFARGRHVGYVKGTQAKSVAMAMDSTNSASKVANLAIDGEHWPMAELED